MKRYFLVAPASPALRQTLRPAVFYATDSNDAWEQARERLGFGPSASLSITEVDVHGVPVEKPEPYRINFPTIGDLSEERVRDWQNTQTRLVLAAEKARNAGADEFVVLVDGVEVHRIDLNAWPWNPEGER